MAIQTFPDARFSTPIELPDSGGAALRNGNQEISFNLGQSVTVINGYTYIVLTTGTTRVSVWSDNPAYYLSTPFDTRKNLINATGAHLVLAPGREPKVFSDGNRLYLAYSGWDGSAFAEERIAICPNPTTDLLDPTGWFHLDMTTTVSSAGAFDRVPDAAGIGTVTDTTHPGSLHVQNNYILISWQVSVSGTHRTTIALGKVGGGSWVTTEFLLDSTYLSLSAPPAFTERQVISYIDPWGYIHAFVQEGNSRHIVHIRSASPYTLNLYGAFAEMTDGTTLLQYWPYKSVLSLSDVVYPGVPAGFSSSLGPACITPDGQYGFVGGHIKETAISDGANSLVYNIFEAADPTRPINNRPNPWLRETRIYPKLQISTFAYPSGVFKTQHINNFNPSPTYVSVYPDVLQFPSNSIQSPTVTPTRELGWTIYPVGRLLTRGSMGFRAVANVQPRMDSAGFFFFRTQSRVAVGSYKDIQFIHINNSGRLDASTLATLSPTGGSSPRTLHDVHTIWMSKPEAIRPVVFGETHANGASQGRYWVTFFGGTPALPDERGAVLRGSNDPIQAYAEDLEW